MSDHSYRIMKEHDYYVVYQITEEDDGPIAECVGDFPTREEAEKCLALIDDDDYLEPEA